MWYLCVSRSVGEHMCALLRGVRARQQHQQHQQHQRHREPRYCLPVGYGAVAVARHDSRLSAMFEQHVFQSGRGVGRRFIANNLEPRKRNYLSNNNNCLRDEEEQEYEKAISCLNGLQSNAMTIRRAILSKNDQQPLDETITCLHRSGLTLDDLDKLSVIHVSGTKGKGSTCALTESILRAHGVKTGFFSSPHLVSVTERIRIDGVPVSKQTFTRAFWRVYQRLDATRSHPTDMPAYFKFLTILSFHIFLEERVDVAVLEVGIGGALDSTNIVRKTKTVGITSLGLEHTQLLGNTLEKIAWQKAGIIKPQCNVFTSVTQPECLEVIRQRAADQHATLHTVPGYEKYFHEPALQKQLQELNNVTQLNGSLAIQLAADWLRQQKNGFHQNYALNSTKLNAKILKGLKSCIWPGRCQIIQFGSFNVHLDGAHTLESMGVCSEWFAKVTAGSAKPRVLIFNTTGDRDSKKLLDVLRRNVTFTMACFVPNIATGAANQGDIQSVFGISEQLKRAKIHGGNWHLLCTEEQTEDNSKLFGFVLDAFNYINQTFAEPSVDVDVGAAEKPTVDVLVTGSLHLIGAAVLALNAFKTRVEPA